MIFPPLTQIAIADLEPAQYGKGTGLFSLSRQLGGSMGIAMIHPADPVHDDRLRRHAHVNLGDPATCGGSTSVIAFDKVFLTMGIAFVCALPLQLLFRTGRVRGGSSAAH